jgi:hypothetical protein
MGAQERYVGVRDENATKALATLSRRPFPQSGDVLASRPTARADVYAIGVVPTRADLVAMRHEDAMKRVRELARVLTVDGWYTCDHTHFTRIASHRNDVERSSARPPALEAGQRNTDPRPPSLPSRGDFGDSERPRDKKRGAECFRGSVI